MKALVYHGPGRRSWQDVPDPVLIDDRDAIIAVNAVTICGTDLHILAGDVPEVKPGRVLGHEAVGTVHAVGPAVRRIRPGDRVIVSCVSACGTCQYCRTGAYGQCLGGGGWILGHRIDGTQAEYVRTPFADLSLHALPDGVNNETALLLSDILPTAYEVGVLNGRIRPGDTVAIIGAGPIGLAAIATARLFSPSRILAIDPAPSRRRAAERFGATAVFESGDDAQTSLRSMTDGLGADVAIEAVGIPATFELGTHIVRPGGHVANVGVHGGPATLHLEELWAKNITVTTGLVDTSSTPTLLGMVASGQIDTTGMITHRFGLTEMMDAFDVFARPADTEALKVALFSS